MISSQEGYVDGDYSNYESKTYEVSPQQYKSFLDFINSQKNQEDREWSLRNNCTDFTVDAAKAAGIDLYRYSIYGHSDPAALAEILTKTCVQTRRGLRCR